MHCSGSASGSASAPPTITGAATLWYFGGQAPSGYATQITLNANGSGTWAVQQSSNIASLSTTSGSQVVVTSTGTAFSQSVGDVKITVTVNGITSSPFPITVRKPWRLVAGIITNACDATFGYADSLNYTIQDQLMTSLPAAIPLNEQWTTGLVNDYSGANWRLGNQGSTTTSSSSPSTFHDFIQGENLALPPNPTPTCNANDNTAVDHWGQNWFIGSTQIGSGTLVQSDNIQKYIGHAVHASILSPVQ